MELCCSGGGIYRAEGQWQEGSFPEAMEPQGGEESEIGSSQSCHRSVQGKSEMALGCSTLWLLYRHPEAGLHSMFGYLLYL